MSKTRCYDPARNAMDDKPTLDLATRAFQMRVLDEFASLRTELRTEVGELRSELAQVGADITQIQTQQAAMARSIATIDQRVTALEERVDERLQEARPIWEAVQIQIQRLGEKLDTVFEDFYDLRSELKLHGRRIAELERRMS